MSATARADRDRAVDLVTRLMAIPGRSGQEKAVVEFITAQLRGAGLPASAIRFDKANTKSPIGGDTGNLIVQLPGAAPGPRRLFMAHMDTVPICVGCKPVKRGQRITSANPATGLGADNRSGAAVVLHTALRLLESKLPHPPLTFLWCIQEEIGLVGARNVDVKMLGSGRGPSGRPAMAFNFDSSDPDQLIIGATGASRMTITVKGLASHAGVHPERGVSAIAIASMAIAELQSTGWHGLIRKPTGRGTSNVGVIHGGEATNVVTDALMLKAEARSHDAKFRHTILRQYERAFTRAVRKLKSAAGKRGRVKIDVVHNYESFALSRTEPAVALAAEAVKTSGMKPRFTICDGGLDANWMHVHGIPTVTLGTGQHEIHTVKEYLDIPQFHAACEVALRLASQG